MKYLYFVLVLIGAICVFDYSMEETQAVPTTTTTSIVVPYNPTPATVALDPTLRESCSPAPLIIDEQIDRIVVRPIDRPRWFPGKNILRAIRNIRNR